MHIMLTKSILRYLHKHCISFLKVFTPNCLPLFVFFNYAINSGAGIYFMKKLLSSYCNVSFASYEFASYVSPWYIFYEATLKYVLMPSSRHAFCFIVSVFVYFKYEKTFKTIIIFLRHNVHYMVFLCDREFGCFLTNVSPFIQDINLE